MDLSVVNHKDYFAKIGDDHKFPIKKFGELADYLIKNKIVKKFHTPYPCSVETLKRVCLLYTSDAADEEDSVDLGGRRIIKNTITCTTLKVSMMTSTSCITRQTICNCKFCR